jgi:hypothetical protein
MIRSKPPGEKNRSRHGGFATEGLATEGTESTEKGREGMAHAEARRARSRAIQNEREMGA